MELWHKIVWFIVAFAIGEMIALAIFYFIRRKFEPGNKHTVLSITKGMLERGVMLLGLVLSVPTIIIFFSALKLGTRLKEQQDSKVSNDYFLIGNLISVAIALIEFIIYKKLEFGY